jgi:hypothetical protein
MRMLRAAEASMEEQERVKFEELGSLVRDGGIRFCVVDDLVEVIDSCVEACDSNDGTASSRREIISS